MLLIMKRLLVNKKDIHQINFDVQNARILKAGEVRLRIEHFAFTSNNITYAVLGEKFKYWNFFPFSESQGIIPTWGYGLITESKNYNLAKGQKVYGYFPMASELIIQATRINNFGFIDSSEHRKDLPSFYNYYEKVESGVLDAEKENLSMLFNPLFATSFLLNEFFADHDFFNAQSIILTSASSKTALALAYIFNKQEKNIEVIGLTSEKNMVFLEDLGIYDKVLSYGELGKLSTPSACIVDFSGNKEMMLKLQNQVLDGLKFCSVVGLSHWDKQLAKINYPFKAELFFAPAYGAQKIKEWGMAEYKTRLNNRLHPFLDWVNTWMEIEHIIGNDILSKYAQMLEGDINPELGIIMSLSE